MKRNQNGMTLLSFIVVLAVVGFALYIGMKLFPMYQEFYSVKEAMNAVSARPLNGRSIRCKTRSAC